MIYVVVFYVVAYVVACCTPTQPRVAPLCCGVLCRGVMCCSVLCFGVLCCGALCCGTLCCGVVVFCIVVFCVVVFCVLVCYVVVLYVVVFCAEGAVTIRQWPGCLPTGTRKREGCVYSACAVCKCVDVGRKRGVGETWRSPTRRLLSAQKLPLHSLSLRLLVQAQLLQHPRHRVVRAHAGLQQRRTPLGVGVRD